MLDNMDLEQIKAAIELVDGKAGVEVSGRVDRGDLLLLADAGVDIISIGALTHAAKSMDISMRIEPAE
jgi:nicotinate-nucleotide pyrophosphorylase (carboxylating)